MLSGNWKGITRKLENLQNDLEEKLEQTVAQAAEHVESVATGHLRNQDLSWPPLSEAYLRQKLRAKGRGSRRFSEKILIRTGTYLQSITSYVEKLAAFVGVKRGVAREADGTDVVDLASVHEHGAPSQNIPARPLWKPTFEEVKDHVVNMFRKGIKEILRS